VAAEARRRGEERARELFEQASDGIFIADLDGRYIDVNSAGCRMLGHSRDEIVGRTIMDLIRPEDLPRLTRVREDLLHQGLHVGEWLLRRKDGSFLLVEVSSKILPDGRWQAFVRDIAERRRVEEELRRFREQERFRAALEAAASAMVVVGTDGRIAFVNGEAERLFGWTREELTGRMVESLLPERFRDPHRSNRDAFFRESVGKRTMGNGRNLFAVRKGAGDFPVEVALTRVGEGDQAFVVASVTDISIRTAAETALRESEQRFRLLVQGTRDYAILMHDPEGRITVWNEGAERILGYRAEEILGERFYRFYPDEEVARGKPELDLRTAVEKGSFEEEGWRVRKDGSRFWAGALISPIFGPARNILGYGKVLRDLTERRKAEQELRTSEARLRQSVLELERFAYTISHDLRSPLRAIQGYSQFLMEQLGDRIDPGSHVLLQRMGDAAVRLDHLIRDLLSYSAITRADVQLGDVDLDEILGHVAGHYPDMAKASLRVRKPLGRVRGQSSFLIQAVSNLLDNAIKFVPEDRVPEIDVWAERGGEGRRSLFIRDNGIGIPRESWEEIFKPFTRLDPARDPEGTGIGLSIVKNAVERMGGQVSLESEAGRGSCFRISLQEA
jgi:PAS domain S-box-containing protein